MQFLEIELFAIKLPSKNGAAISKVDRSLVLRATVPIKGLYIIQWCPANSRGVHHVMESVNVVVGDISSRSNDIGAVTFHKCTPECQHRGLRLLRERTSPSSAEFQGARESRVEIHAGTILTYYTAELAPSDKKEFQKGYLVDRQFNLAWMEVVPNLRNIDGFIYIDSANQVLRLCVPNIE